MKYLWPTASSMSHFSDDFGVMTSPAMGMVPLGVIEGRSWACDNEAFTNRFTPDRFFAFLKMLYPWRSTCLFVAIPDRVANAIATLYRWRSYDYAYRVCEMGYQAAFVAQDGAELFGFPPDDQWDWLFIGGSTEWKLGVDADLCILSAKTLGKFVHVGRVNGIGRMHHFAMIGADTCDGTAAIHEPDIIRSRFTRGMMQRSMPLFER